MSESLETAVAYSVGCGIIFLSVASAALPLILMALAIVLIAKHI